MPEALNQVNLNKTVKRCFMKERCLQLLIGLFIICFCTESYLADNPKYSSRFDCWVKVQVWVFIEKHVLPRIHDRIGATAVFS